MEYLNTSGIVVAEKTDPLLSLQSIGCSSGCENKSTSYSMIATPVTKGTLL